MKEEILYLTHKKNPEIEKQIREIRDQMGDRTLTIISDSVTFDIEGTNLFLFDETIVQKMDIPTVKDSMVPGSTYLPVFWYIQQKNEAANYYWVIEYDVRFTGEWGTLFDHFSDSGAGLITSHICSYNKEPEWYWWELSHPQKNIPKEERIRSFNPIYRISHEVYCFLKQEIKSGWKGHYEITFPTLIHHSDYKLLDFGGNGDFTSKKNQFYTSRSDRWGNLYTGTMRYRPATRDVGFRKNKLYHPVKPSGVSFFRFYTGNIYRLIKLWISKLNKSDFKQEK